jgi:hypothetical protein
LVLLIPCLCLDSLLRSLNAYAHSVAPAVSLSH